MNKLIGLEIILLLKGISYSDIAKKFGISRQAVNLWAKKGVIPGDKLEGLAEMLNCPKSYLVSKVNIQNLENNLHNFLSL